jgi:hypothetical protein
MKKQLFILSICCLFFQSCISYWAVKLTKMEQKKASLDRMYNGDKEVLFLGMHHVGLEMFYADVKRIADSLQKLNYTIIYESAASNFKEGDLRKDTNDKKFRKVMGLSLTKSGYYDTTTKKIAGVVTYKGKYKLVNQWKNWEMMDTAEAKKVDLPMEDLIAYYEKNVKPIPLDSCDYVTPIHVAYPCNSMGLSTMKSFKREVVEKLRNKHIANYILQSNQKKFLVVYGLLHYKGIKEELKSKDKRWK